jgi:hypothetical protein
MTESAEQVFLLVAHHDSLAVKGCVSPRRLVYQNHVRLSGCMVEKAKKRLSEAGWSFGRSL